MLTHHLSYSGMRQNNPDAARDYLNRLRMLRQSQGSNNTMGGDSIVPDRPVSAMGGVGGMASGINNMMNTMGGGGGGNTMSNNMMNNMGGGTNNMMNTMGVNNNISNMGGRGNATMGTMNNTSNNNNRQSRKKSRSPEEFTIEEYQASLQEFLNHDDDELGFSPSARANSNVGSNNDSGITQLAGNVSNAGSNVGGHLETFRVPTGGGGRGGGANMGRDRNNLGSTFQVPTSTTDRPSLKSLNTLDLPNTTNRDTFKSLDTLDLPDTTNRDTFKSLDSDGRPSIRLGDDMDIRGTFTSVDTMDLMSIGASINDILEEDVKKNGEEARIKYSRRLSQTSLKSRGAVAVGGRLSNLIQNPGSTMEVKTFDHGHGGGGGPKKIKKGVIDPRLPGVTTTVPTATGDGNGRSSLQKSFDRRGSVKRGSLLSLTSKDLDMDNFNDSDGRMSFGNMWVTCGVIYLFLLLFFW